VKSRLVASAAISALVLLGATGCTFITPQSTEIQYSASDGVNIPDSEGPLEIRNAMIIATEDGSVGNLVAAIVNTTDKAEVLNVDVDGSDESLTLRVAAGDTVSLGANAEPMRIDDLGVKPGATVEVYFQSGDATGASAQIPVLDGTLPYYADLVPEEDES
jgi:hypothetical protein